MWPQVEEYNFRQPREEPQTLTKMQDQRRKDKAGPKGRLLEPIRCEIEYDMTHFGFPRTFPRECAVVGPLWMVLRGIPSTRSTRRSHSGRPTRRARGLGILLPGPWPGALESPFWYEKSSLEAEKLWILGDFSGSGRPFRHAIAWLSLDLRTISEPTFKVTELPYGEEPNVSYDTMAGSAKELAAGKFSSKQVAKGCLFIPFSVLLLR